MLFIWNINNRGSAKTLLRDLWPIYRSACGDNDCSGKTVSWETLNNAAREYFVSQNKQAYADHFESWGGLAGVNEDP
jgi:hypothetical protein